MKKTGLFSRFIQLYKLSLRNVLANRKRSVLTCLGIIIGVGTMVGISSILNIMNSAQELSWQQMGTNDVTIENIATNKRPHGLKQEDKEYLSSIDGVAALGEFSAFTEATSIFVNSKEYKNNGILARDIAYFENTDSEVLKKGRQFSQEDMDNCSKVCVIDSEVEKKCFAGKDPIGQKITIKGVEFTVIGIDYKNSFSMNGIYNADSIFIPITTMQKLFGISPKSFTLYVKDKGGSQTVAIHDETVKYLDRVLGVKTITKPYMDIFLKSILDEWNLKQRDLANRQIMISGICLLVGGIGIMNMMIVSVTERTREIGLRKALGATPGQIQSQFLLESIILSLVGGTIGILIGLIITVGANYYQRMTMSPESAAALPFIIDYTGILLGFGFSVLVGIVFGWAPARKASKLNPIDALRL